MLGDVLRALAHLAPDTGEERETVLDMLGYHLVRRAVPVLEPVPAPSAEVPSFPERIPPAAPVAPEESAPPNELELESTDQSPAPGVPRWLAAARPLVGPLEVPPPPTPPLIPRVAIPSILIATAGMWRRSRRLDVDRAINACARRAPLPALPFLRRRSLSAGVQVLLDCGESAALLSVDQREVVAQLRAVAGEERVQAFTFRGAPDVIYGEGRPRRRRYAPPDPGRPVLVLSDLGLASRVDAPYDWAAFAARLQAAGHEVVALVPVHPSRWPAVLMRSALRLAFWGTGRPPAATAGRLESAAAQLDSPLRELEVHSPGAIELAEVLSLASRLEPWLLRRARLELLPHLEPGVEADLWFSDLIHSRGPSFAVFLPRHAAALRTRLRERGRAALAMQLLEKVERGALQRVEEQINFLALGADPSDAPLPQVDELLGGVVRSYQDAQDEQRKELAFWAYHAIPRLPTARRSDAAHALSLLASEDLRLPAAAASEEQPLVDLRAVRTVGRTTHIGVTLRGLALELSHPPAPGSLELEVPATTPPRVELSWEDEGRWRLVDCPTWSPVLVEADAIRIRAADGSVHHLRRRPRPEEDSPTVRRWQARPPRELVGRSGVVEQLFRKSHGVNVVAPPGSGVRTLLGMVERTLTLRGGVISVIVDPRASVAQGAGLQGQIVAERLARRFMAAPLTDLTDPWPVVARAAHERGALVHIDLRGGSFLWAGEAMRAFDELGALLVISSATPIPGAPTFMLQPLSLEERQDLLRYESDAWSTAAEPLAARCSTPLGVVLMAAALRCGAQPDELAQLLDRHPDPVTWTVIRLNKAFRRSRLVTTLRDRLAHATATARQMGRSGIPELMALAFGPPGWTSQELGAAFSRLKPSAFSGLLQTARDVSLIELNDESPPRWRMHPVVSEFLRVRAMSYRSPREEPVLEALETWLMNRLAEVDSGVEALRAEEEALTFWLERAPRGQVAVVLRKAAHVPLCVGSPYLWLLRLRDVLADPGLSGDRDILLDLQTHLAAEVGDFDQAMGVARARVQRALDARDYREVARLEEAQGSVLERCGEWGEAAEAYERALQLPLDVASAGRCWQKRGDVLRRLRRAPEAVAAWRRALDFHRHAGSTLSIGSIWQRLGNHAVTIGDRREVRRCFREELRAYEQTIAEGRDAGVVALAGEAVPHAEARLAAALSVLVWPAMGVEADAERLSAALRTRGLSVELSPTAAEGAPSLGLASRFDAIVYLFLPSSSLPWSRLEEPHPEAVAVLVNGKRADLKQSDMLGYAMSDRPLLVADEVGESLVDRVHQLVLRGPPLKPGLPQAHASDLEAPLGSAAEVAVFAWIHVADLHLGKQATSSQETVLATLADDVRGLVLSHRAPSPDAILVTGDLSQQGADHEFEAAHRHLQVLAAATGLGLAEVFVVPGNHDVRRVGSSRASSLVTAIRAGGESLDEHVHDAAAQDLLLERLQSFQKLAALLAPVERFGLAWRARREVRGRHVRLAGLNTAALSTDDHDAGRLKVGRAQLSSALGEGGSRDEELVLVLGHHPLHGGWLGDETTVLSYLDRSADVYLSAHVHTNQAAVIDRGLIMVAAGRAVGESEGEPDWAYNLAAVYAAPEGRLHLRVWPRRWSSKAQRFHSDAQALPRAGAAFVEVALRQRPQPSPRAAASELLLEDAEGAIRFVLADGREEKDTKNGRFWVDITLRVRPGAPTTADHLKRIRVECVRKGLRAYCYELHVSVVREAGGEQVHERRALDNNGNFVTPIPIPPEGILLAIAAYCRPRLPTQYPYEWDSEPRSPAYVVVEASQQRAGHAQRVFAYRGARSLEPVETIPGPPRLSDAEVERLHRQGFLSLEERKLLDAIDQEMRYLLLISREPLPSWGGPPSTVELIEQVVHERHGEDTYLPSAPGLVGRRHVVDIEPGTREVVLPSRPVDPRSVCMTIRGVEIDDVSVKGDRLMWEHDWVNGTVVFRYLEARRSAPKKFNTLVLKSQNPREYDVKMRPNTTMKITSGVLTEFKSYRTSDSGVATAKAMGEQGRVELQAHEEGTATISFEARAVTIQTGIPPKGKKGKPGKVSIFAENAWTAMTINVTVEGKAGAGGKTVSKPADDEASVEGNEKEETEEVDENENDEADSKPPAKKPKALASPAARMIIRAENFIDNGEPAMALEALVKAEGLEGAVEEKKRIAEVRKRAKKTTRS